MKITVFQQFNILVLMGFSKADLCFMYARKRVEIDAHIVRLGSPKLSFSSIQIVPLSALSLIILSF